MVRFRTFRNIKVVCIEILDELKQVTCRFDLSEFESVIRIRNSDFSLKKTRNILLTTTADCERRFSDINNNWFKNSFKTLTWYSIFISINDTQITDFNPRPYVKVWLGEHRLADSRLFDKGRQKIYQKGRNKYQKQFFINKFK